jgi:hypothetical protein
MIYKLIGIFTINLLLTYNALAQKQQFLQAKYDEDELKITYINFIDSLDPVMIVSKYPIAIKNLLSAKYENQKLGIRTLKETQEIEIIPWLIPFLDSKDNYVRIEAVMAISNLVEYYTLKRRDNRIPERVSIKPMTLDDTDLRPLAWLILQMLRLPDSHPNLLSYAATMTGYLNLQIFELEIKMLLDSKHPAVVSSAKYAIELLQNGHQANTKVE